MVGKLLLLYDLNPISVKYSRCRFTFCRKIELTRRIKISRRITKKAAVEQLPLSNTHSIYYRA